MEQWVEGSLSTADPNAADLDSYVKPLITIAELLRQQRMPDVSRRVYERAIEAVDQHCQTHQVDLHRGALYANYAIAQFEIGRYSQALPWLHAAANEDIRHRSDIKTIYDSYAFSDEGIFTQWLNAHVIKNLPVDALDFVNAQLRATISESDVRAFVKWLAGRGDLNLVSGIVEYASVGTMSDYHAQTVRLTSIRDLATLFEVLLKMLGKAHKNTDVAAAFATPPTLAGIICDMHFVDKRKARRKTPTLNGNSRPGLFRNSLIGWPDLLAAIDAGIDFAGDRGHTVDQVWQHLRVSTLCPAYPAADAVAKRLLIAYRLRNETSHSLDPTNAAIAPHYDEFRLYLLEAVLVMFFWATTNGAIIL
jgi:hypothetical protein